MSFNLNVPMIEEFEKEVTIYVHFRKVNYASFDISHVEKLEITKAGLVCVYAFGHLISTFIIDDISTLSYCSCNNPSDVVYIIYSGEFV